MDVKTEGLISERAVYGHWESEVVNIRYFLMTKKYPIDDQACSHIQRIIQYWLRIYDLSGADNIFIRPRLLTPRLFNCDLLGMHVFILNCSLGSWRVFNWC
jgi:hypothetical protein